MKLVRQTLVDLSDRNNKDRLGHISFYELEDGSPYHVYYLEERYFGFMKYNNKNKLIESGRSIDEYHYSLDHMFLDKGRHLGWEI